MNNELINVFTQIPTYIFWKDVNSVFLGCNNYFAQAAGLTSPQEIQGKTDFDLAWENYAELYREGDREVLAEPNLIKDYKIKLMNNKDFFSLRSIQTPNYRGHGCYNNSNGMRYLHDS